MSVVDSAGPGRRSRSVHSPWGICGFLVVLLSALFSSVGCVDGPAVDLVDQPHPGMPKEIDAEPILSVGVVTGDTLQEFDRVMTPFALPDGSVVVPVAGSRDIRVFSQNGDFVKRLGRRGGGPGEFVFLSAVWPRGDTIEALDGRLRRVTRFLPDGTVEIVSVATGSVRDLSLSAGPLGQGWALGGVLSASYGERDRIVVRHFDRSGDHLGALDSISGIARYITATYGGPEPLSPRAVFASNGTHLYLGDTLIPAIRAVDAAGIVAREIVWEPAMSVSPAAAFDHVIDSAVARTFGDRRLVTREQLEAAPVPGSLSAFWDFVLDPEGFVWIQPYEPLVHAFALGATIRGGVGSQGAWRVFTLDGRYVTSVDIPNGLELTQVTRTSVVGIRRDALGIESVHVYRVRRN